MSPDLAKSLFESTLFFPNPLITSLLCCKQPVLLQSCGSGVALQTLNVRQSHHRTTVFSFIELQVRGRTARFEIKKAPTPQYSPFLSMSSFSALQSLCLQNCGSGPQTTQDNATSASSVLRVRQKSKEPEAFAFLAFTILAKSGNAPFVTIKCFQVTDV